MPSYLSLLTIASLLIPIFLRATESDNVFIDTDTHDIFINTHTDTHHTDTTQPQPQKSNILLLTAHPDDECLFFAPTVLALITHKYTRLDAQSQSRDTTAPEVQVTTAPEVEVTTAPVPEVFSLCLSTGNADGLGETRKKELEGSLEVLGVGEGRRWVLDHPLLQDNITAPWDASIISDVITPYIVENHITTILTFDRGGISGHPNHRSLPSGVRHFLSKTNDITRSSHSPHPHPRAFTLITIPSLTKYTGILGPILARIDIKRSHLLGRLDDTLARFLVSLGMQVRTPESSSSKATIPDASSKANPNGNGNPHIMPVFVSGIKEYMQAIQAMRAHRSQLVWFRWLYVLFSRYMWVNEWKEIVVHV